MTSLLAPTRDRLANSSDEVKRTIEIVWSAYRSVLSKEGTLAYVSTAITSGERMYDVLDRLGLASADELKVKAPKTLFDEVIRPNIETGTALARRVASVIDHPVVAPSVFEARSQRWTQDEYMAMWLRLIEEHVGRIYMAPGWEWSNGGAEEFLQAVQMCLGLKSRHDIEILDADGQAITLQAGLDAIGKALRALHARKRKAPILADAFKGLVTARNFFVVKLVRTPTAWPNRAFLRGLDSDVVRSIALDMAPLLAEDYGINLEDFAVDFKTGVPRKNDAVPEGIMLKAEEPPAHGGPS